MAGHASPKPAGVVITVRLRVYCRGASAGPAEITGTGLPHGPTTQLRDDCEMTMPTGIAWGCPEVVKEPGTRSETVSEPVVRRYEGTGGSVTVTDVGPL